jgi:hypothetical protein
MWKTDRLRSGIVYRFVSVERQRGSFFAFDNVLGEGVCHGLVPWRPSAAGDDEDMAGRRGGGADERALVEDERRSSNGGSVTVNVDRSGAAAAMRWRGSFRDAGKPVASTAFRLWLAGVWRIR